ncbi:MAG: C4-type zinc ribbon domain-containing protein [SAR202 cluster bacterium]|nr:C4-type zinc ribbon domain-containing protein [SAR202 cluster bacterium]
MEKQENLDKRLYGGGITSPRHLSAAEEEREFLQQQRASEENTLLELMVETDDLQTSANASRENLARVEAERSVEEVQLTSDLERLTAELESQGKARSKMAPTIPPQFLAVYESLLKTRDGSAVAKVERGMCQGCRLALPTLELQRARSSEAIARCGSCGRILYVV